jgi:hypothetical protein
MSRAFLPGLVAAFALAAAPMQPETVPPVVVELFTSQGCNTCPPADEYFGELVKQPDVIALAFHVDYWNYIGWTDPFARPWASARQRDYHDSLRTRFVYTPQMVVGGAAQTVGSDEAACDALIRAAETKPDAARPSLALRWREDGALAVDVGEGESIPAQPATLWLVGFDKQHVTKVLRGENEGRTLTDYHPVRSYRRLGAWAGWSEEFIVSAAEAKTLGDGGIAVLLQANGTGPILTAAQIAQRG